MGHLPELPPLPAGVAKAVAKGRLRDLPPLLGGGDGDDRNRGKSDGLELPAGTAPAASGGGEGDGGREGLEDGLPTRVAMAEQHRPATDHSEEIPVGTWRGWIGKGRPREVTFMGRTAAFHDGGASAPQEGGRRERGGCHRWAKRRS